MNIKPTVGCPTCKPGSPICSNRIVVERERERERLVVEEGERERENGRGEREREKYLF